MKHLVSSVPNVPGATFARARQAGNWVGSFEFLSLLDLAFASLVVWGTVMLIGILVAQTIGALLGL